MHGILLVYMYRLNMYIDPTSWNSLPVCVIQHLVDIFMKLLNGIVESLNTVSTVCASRF